MRHTNNPEKTTNNTPPDRLLPKLTLSFFRRPKSTIFIWLILVVFGAVSYAALLKREGFPSVTIPVAIVQGTYIAGDPAKVDQEIAKPISDIARKQKGISIVQSQSSGSFYTVVLQYESSVDARSAIKQLKKEVSDTVKLPASATITYNVPYFGITGTDNRKIDDLISVHAAKGNPSTTELTEAATAVSKYLDAHKPPLVESFFVRNPFETAANPQTGEQAVVQKTFNRSGQRTGDSNQFFNSVTIGVTGVKNVDVIKLDKQLTPLLESIPQQAGLSDYRAFIVSSDSNAPAINEEISELQKVLLEGLVAVLIIGSIVIAIRASLITVLSMITVVLATLGLLYLIGYSLNVITLFALILGLSLIVDDTIIMVEAIDASRRNAKTAREAVKVAVSKISRAMVAATLTAALSFAPLLFVGGILGSFIRAIPITIISALLISLVVALIFIPLFARGLLLRPKQLGKKGVTEVAAGLEARIAAAICKPMLWARGSTKKLFSVGIAAVLISLAFVVAAGVIFGKVTFNIFPPSKDSNEIAINLTFPPNTTIEKAEQISDQANEIVANTLGKNFVDATYDGNGNEASAIGFINLISYEKRSVTSAQLVKQLQQRFDSDFKAASVNVGQIDVGPPASAFTVEVRTEDRAKGYKLAGDLKDYLQTTTLTRTSGKKAHFTSINASSPDQYVRNDGKLSINVTANFDGDDTTTLVTLGQDAVKKEFTAAKLASYGLSKDAINFNLGQESENQDSFKSLAIAFPLLLVVIYILLVIEFRSLLQPLFIFMAIPFSLFGITLGLYLTHNAFSFFGAMGFFALIGLSLKNTILLTDYANQSRRKGMGAIDSAVAALSERFRPLVATSLTAVCSLIPLAITSPFWQGLAVVLIFGLLSSTMLVILVFPYYYLGGEYLRSHISRKAFFVWLVPTVILAFGLAKVSAKLIPVAILLTLVVAFVLNKHKKSHSKKS